LHPQIELADFGNARFLSDNNAVVRGLEGTISYMSPEMRRGGDYNTKTDIWSLGMMLLNLLFHDEDDFPNFEIMGSWAARNYAKRQHYQWTDLEKFISSLFVKSNERPSVKELLEVDSPFELTDIRIHLFNWRMEMFSRNCLINFRNRI
jgi:serine/threonine protein kinase